MGCWCRHIGEGSGCRFRHKYVLLVMVAFVTVARSQCTLACGLISNKIVEKSGQEARLRTYFDFPHLINSDKGDVEDL